MTLEIKPTRIHAWGKLTANTGSRLYTQDIERWGRGQSPTQWPPLTSIIYLCQRRDWCWCLGSTVLQDSCKMQLCSRFCFLEAIFLFVCIFSCDIKFNFTYKPPLPNPINDILHLKSLLPNRKKEGKKIS